MKIEPLLSIYNDAYWEKTAVFYESGGFLVTSRLRILRGQLNREEKAKFDKERHMCLRYASYGFQIEHLAEFPGKSTPDVNVVRHPAVQGIVVVNGKRAELKSLKGANNIVKRAKYAIFHQNAELILFAFPSRSKPIENTLKVLSIKGIHGYYYFEDEHGYQSF